MKFKYRKWHKPMAGDPVYIDSRGYIRPLNRENIFKRFLRRIHVLPRDKRVPIGFAKYPAKKGEPVWVDTFGTF